MLTAPDSSEAECRPSGGPDISVVIVSFNTRALLIECLESLYRPDQVFSFETIIVDNDSHDGTADAVQAGFPQVRMIQNEENLGFGTAMNMGAAIARGRYLMVLNPDTLVPPETIPRLLGFLESENEPRLASCHLVGPQKSYQLSCARFPTPLRIFMLFTRLAKVIPIESFQSYYEKFDWDNLALDEPGADSVWQVDTVLGAFFILPLDEFRKAGGFDERFFMHFEEIDLMKKLETRGCHTYMIPDVSVMHYGGASTKQDYEKMRFEQQRSLLLYLHKWHGMSAAQSIRFFLIIMALIRYVSAIASERVRGREHSASQFRSASRAILVGLLRMNFQSSAD
ncbi:MAG: glycosyltransferase family 2 protein [Actinobacteria bacterium]|nr:glycosyltransferase family 2 protein [Actinomycetota bacterium]